MIRPKARFYWHSPDEVDVESIHARNIYELYADDLIGRASRALIMRHHISGDISIGDRVEVSTDDLKYDPPIGYLAFEVVAFDAGGDCILDFRSVSYASEREERE